MNVDAPGGSTQEPTPPPRHWHLVVRHKHPDWHGHCRKSERTLPFSGEVFTAIDHSCEQTHWHGPFRHRHTEDGR